MLYFLVFAIPFTAVMIYLTRRNRMVKEKYELLLSRLALANDQLPEPLSLALESLKPSVPLTYQDIKQLEVSIQKLEVALALSPSRFISNTFNSRWKQLLFMEEKLRLIEKTLATKKIQTS